MTESFEIQMFVKTNEPIITLDYAQGRKEAEEKFRKAIENRRGKAIRMVQVICDFTTMERKMSVVEIELMFALRLHRGEFDNLTGKQIREMLEKKKEKQKPCTP